MNKAEQANRRAEILADLKRRERENAAHTPGPWHVDQCDDDLIYDANGLHIATVGNSEQDELPSQHITANAKLIATAPELLEALWYAFMTLGATGANADKMHVNRQCWEFLRTVIAKATEGGR